MMLSIVYLSPSEAVTPLGNCITLAESPIKWSGLYTQENVLPEFSPERKVTVASADDPLNRVISYET